MDEHIQTSINAAGHVASGAALLTSILGFLPPLLTGLASLAATIWYVISIYHSAPAQKWLKSRRERRIQRLLAKAQLLQSITSNQPK